MYQIAIKKVLSVDNFISFFKLGMTNEGNLMKIYDGYKLAQQARSTDFAYRCLRHIRRLEIDISFSALIWLPCSYYLQEMVEG